MKSKNFNEIPVIRSAPSKNIAFIIQYAEIIECSTFYLAVDIDKFLGTFLVNYCTFSLLLETFHEYKIGNILFDYC